MENNLNNNSIQRFMSDIKTPNFSKTVIKPFPLFKEELTPLEFWKCFLKHFKNLNNKEFVIDKNSKTFVYTILFYFLKNQKFFDSPLIYRVDNSTNSFGKGLLIVGGYGVGKTIIINTIASLMNSISVNNHVYPVRFHTTKGIVEEFENSESTSKNSIIEKYRKGFRIFDDVKYEREASNYGKIDLFEDILYKRYETKNFRTILLCNYDPKYDKNMEKAIDSFSRYGERNYDRLFEGFNFIEVKGISKRR